MHPMSERTEPDLGAPIGNSSSSPGSTNGDSSGSAARAGTVGTASTGVFAPKMRVITIGIAVAVLLNGFEQLGITTAMPVASADLNGSRLYGWAFSAFLLGQVLGMVWAGGSSDVHGPFRPYAIGLTAFGTGLLLCGLAPSMPALVAGRAISGLGSGVVLVLNWALIGRLYDESVRSQMLAITSSAWVLPGLIGPAAAGWVADHATWRLVFLALLPILVGVAVMLLPRLRLIAPVSAVAVERPTPPASTSLGGLSNWNFWDATARFRNLAGLLVAIGAALMLAGLTATSLPQLIALAVPGAVLIGFAQRTLFPAGTIKSAPGLPAVVMSLAYLIGGFTGMEAFLPLILKELKSLSSTQAGLMLTTGALTWTTGSWIQAKAPNFWATAKTRAAAALALFVGVLIVSTLTLGSIPIGVAFAGWAFAALGMGVAFNSVSDATFRTVSQTQIGVASSATQLSGAIAGALIAGVDGAIINAGKRAGWSAASGFKVYFVLQAVVFALAIFSVSRIPDYSTSQSDS